MANNYANSILDAVGTVTNGALSKQKFDMTIKATVIKVLDEKNKYVCKYEGGNFTAIGTTDTYEIDDVVYVIVPQNDWNMDKYIIFKVEKDLIESLDPFKNFLNVNNGHSDKYFPDKVGIIPNYYDAPNTGSTYNYPNAAEETEYKLYDLSKQDEPFTRMGISIQFSTNHIVDWNCCEGNYGLWIKIYQQGAEDDESMIFSLDTSDMLGNVYSSEGWYEYKKVFDISGIHIDENTCIKFFLMEDGNFKAYDKDMNLNYVHNTNHNEYQIKAKNMNIYFGYAASDFYEGQIQLICDGDMRYDESWKKDPTKKKRLNKKLKWYIYEKSKGYLIRKKIPISSSRDNYVKVYTSNSSSSEYKMVRKVTPPDSSCTITISNTSEEKINCKIKYWQKNINFENGENSPYVFKESNIITFYRLNAVDESEKEGDQLTKINASGEGTFSIGRSESIIGEDSVSIGHLNEASGTYTVALGSSNAAKGYYSTAIGRGCLAEGDQSVAMGSYSRTAGEMSVAMGSQCSAMVGGSVAMGDHTTANGYGAVASGYKTYAGWGAAHAEGRDTQAVNGDGAHAEGYNTYAKGQGAHSEGIGYLYFNQDGTLDEERSTGFTLYQASHVEGYNCKITAKFGGNGAHAEGYETIADSDGSHAEGYYTYARGSSGCHAEGYRTQALGSNGSHAEGYQTIAASNSQHVFGKCNIEDAQSTYVEIVGNGTADNARSNARTLDWNGNEQLTGNLTINYNGHEINVGQALSQLLGLS